MREYAPGIESSELSLVDVSKTSVDVAGPATGTPSSGGMGPASSAGMGPVSAATAASAERYLAKAAEEHAAGHIDRALWERAVVQGGGDNAGAKNIYLLSRATAIRVAKRKSKEARRAAVVESLSNGPDTGFSIAAPAAKAEAMAKDSDRARLGSAKQKHRRAMLIAGFLGFLLVVVGVLVAALWDSGPDPISNIAGAVPRGNILARATPSGSAAAAPPNAGKTANASGEDYVGRARELEKAGNWNVLVLYGVEWTRKQPRNPDAWKALSQGYVKMRQYAEAVDSATKAVQLAPENYVLWQNLGQINLASQAPTEALVAFHQAAVLNDQDVISLIQEGILNTQLGRVAEARLAFARALSLSPQDVQALCGAAVIAKKEGRMKDAEAMMRQVNALGERCRDPSDGESVRVAGG